MIFKKLRRVWEDDILRKMLLLFGVLLVVIYIWAWTQLSYYPQSVKIAYLLNPLQLGKVIYYHHNPGKGQSAAKSIREPYFAQISKRPVMTNENLFWELKMNNRHALVEHRTGRIVFDKVKGRQMTPYHRYQAIPEVMFIKSTKKYDQDMIGRLVWGDLGIIYEKTRNIVFYDEMECQSIISDHQNQVKEILLEARADPKVFFPKAEAGLRTENISSKTQFILPVYLEKAFYQGKPAWIIVYNWEDKVNDSFLALAHSACVVLSEANLEVLTVARCK